MKRPVETNQRQVRRLDFKVDTDGTLLQGGGHDGVSSTKNSTGDYTITPATPGARLLGLGFIPIDTETYPQIDESDTDENAVNVVFKDTDGTPTATDTAFWGHIILSDAELEY